MGLDWCRLVVDRNLCVCIITSSYVYRQIPEKQNDVIITHYYIIDANYYIIDNAWNIASMYFRCKINLFSQLFRSLVFVLCAIILLEIIKE